MTITKAERQRFTSWLGKRSYAARVQRFGLERIQEIARENGKRGGRPPKSKAAKGQTRPPKAGGTK